MAKSRRRCEQCGKLRYGTQMAALSAAVGAAKHGKSWRAYYNQACGWWHLTTQPYKSYEQLRKEAEEGDGA